MKLRYIVIPLVVLATSWVGGSFSSPAGAWYQALAKPAWIPAGWVFGVVWTLIYVLTAASAFLVLDAGPRLSRTRRAWIIAVFLLNAFLNAFWTYLFFALHELALASWEAALLGVTVIVFMLLIQPVSRRAAALLAPYAFWTVFATYLAGTVWLLNR